MYGIRSDQGYHETLKGIRMKTIVYGERSLMTEFRLAKDAELPEHAHPHEQTGILMEGAIKLFIGSEARILKPGDSWCVPANAKHRADIIADSVAIEVFIPQREEYLRYANESDIIA